ncbi:hypothetical protein CAUPRSCDRAFT_12182 [Caulochytrium protostelioides]|uniref:Uncharacterized protein n=1 Tax=Caulochytrium protostelioides TaxID=1555241 RepID=A0A4P9WXU9_9FUNG|nr:hypothetical protein CAUPRSCDRAFT_12182 [Caulochytrium protostelioides]
MNPPASRPTDLLVASPPALALNADVNVAPWVSAEWQQLLEMQPSPGKARKTSRDYSYLVLLLLIALYVLLRRYVVYPEMRALDAKAIEANAAAATAAAVDVAMAETAPREAQGLSMTFDPLTYPGNTVIPTGAAMASGPERPAVDLSMLMWGLRDRTHRSEGSPAGMAMPMHQPMAPMVSGARWESASRPGMTSRVRLSPPPPLVVPGITRQETVDVAPKPVSAAAFASASASMPAGWPTGMPSGLSRAEAEAVARRMSWGSLATIAVHDFPPPWSALPLATPIGTTPGADVTIASRPV